MNIRQGKIILCIGLIIIILIPYWQIQGHDFINYDDNVYVTENRHVQKGFSAESLVWAFTATDVGFWHPLTWVSLILDFDLFRFNPAGYHWTNLIIHITSTLLLFIILNRMTAAPWKSVFVAALFAVHPLHVESVAWIAERKDVLSAVFGMLSLGAYVLYAEQPSRPRYLAVAIFFILSLMAKSMLVTLPCVFLLLDFWPLGRIGLKGWAVKDGIGRCPADRDRRPGRERSLSWLIMEKIPLILLTIPFIWLSIYAQSKFGGLTALAAVSFPERIANAFTSYGFYLLKTVWPAGLAIFYPHYGMPPPWQFVLSFLLVSAVTAVVIKYLRAHPYLAVGWLWFLGTLVPVIGLIQVGLFSRADRYTYIPLIGIFIMAAWYIPAQINRWRRGRPVVAVMSVVAVLVLVTATWHQVGYWQNDMTLFGHALEVTKNNYKAHNNVGLAYLQRGDYGKAERHITESIRIRPEIIALNNLGLVYAKQNRLPEAERLFRRALEIKPDYVEALINMGALSATRGRTEEAIGLFRAALAIDPEEPTAIGNLSLAMKGAEKTGARKK